MPDTEHPRCLTHGIPDCSPLLNGCDWPSHIVLVTPGWTGRHIIPPVAILTYPDGTMRVEHACKVVYGRRIRNAPALQLGNGHRVVQADPLTIVASIACADCGLHGWVTDGKWVTA